jgi:hypothetical protein
VTSAAPPPTLEKRAPRIHQFRPGTARLMRWCVWPFAFIVVLCAARFWFGRYHSNALVGDDLYNWISEHATPSWLAGLHAAFIETTGSKYRPIANLLALASYHAFGATFPGYKHLDEVVEALNVTLFARLAWLLSRSLVLTVGLAAVALIARFDIYYVMQGFGGAEGLSITFLLLGLLAARHGLHGNTKGVLAASLAYAAAIYTYEGTLAMGAVLFLLPLVATRSGRVWRNDLGWRLGWAMAPVVAAGSNVAVKTALGVHFLTGTAGTNIALVPSMVFSFFEQGTATLMGFSMGPDYLSGASWSELPRPEGLLLGIGFAGTMLLLACATTVRLIVRRRPGSGWLARVTEFRVLLLGLALGISLLVTASGTIRQDYRFLYGPYLVLLLGAAWAFGRWRPVTRRLFPAAAWVTCCAVLVAAALSVEVTYNQYATNTYFFSAQAGGDSIYQQVFVDDAPRLADTTILIDTQGSASFTNGWMLAGEAFFSVYANGRPIDVRFIPSLAAVSQQTHLRSQVQLLIWNGTAVVPSPLPTS